MITEQDLFEIDTELGYFIREAFDYFNGVINPKRLANLKIIIKDYKDDIYGYTTFNDVTIVINPIIRIYGNIYSINKEEFFRKAKNELIYTIVHELYHVEQEINREAYVNSRYDRNMIEDQVDYRTCIHLLQNITPIYNDLNLVLDENRLRDIINSRFSDHIDNYQRMFDNEFYWKETIKCILRMGVTDTSSIIAKGEELYSYDNISLTYNDCNSVIIRNNGVWSSVYDGDRILNNIRKDTFDNCTHECHNMKFHNVTTMLDITNNNTMIIKVYASPQPAKIFREVVHYEDVISSLL